VRLAWATAARDGEDDSSVRPRAPHDGEARAAGMRFRAEIGDFVSFFLGRARAEAAGWRGIEDVAGSRGDERSWGPDLRRDMSRDQRDDPGDYTDRMPDMTSRFPTWE